MSYVGKRFVYRKNDRGEVVAYEVGRDWIPENGERVPVLTDRHYEGIATVDGVDISSRRKRKEYMRQNNLTDADDFKGDYARAAKERQARASGELPAEERRRLRDLIGRIDYEMEKKR